MTTEDVPERVLAYQQGSRTLGFDKATVDVRQVTDDGWITLHELLYHATREDFTVPLHQPTDFASVPREFVWFIPRYGRYTKAAILHDYLCRERVGHGLERIEADAILRQAMREEGVSFMRRWIMWAAVRWGALTKAADRKDWGREAWRVVVLTVIALPVVAPAAVVILITRFVLYVIEWLVYLPLAANRTMRVQQHPDAKKVNKPAFRSRL